MQRITKPYNKLIVTFQGIIFVPRARAYIKDKTTNNVVCCNVAKIDINFGNLLKAVLPLDAGSKLGGPIVGRQLWNKPQSWPGISGEYYPLSKFPDSGSSPGVHAHEWWRWALVFMHPSDNVRLFETPKIMTASEMGSMFQMFQLLRHNKTKLKVQAIDDMGQKWSPICSLLVQDQYFETRTTENSDPTQYFTANLPLTGVIGNDCNEPRIPSRPSRNTHDSFATIQCVYSGTSYPSFSTLAALGAPMAFPPQQKPVTKGSFNKHSMTGRNDPLQGQWMTLLPKNLQVVSDAEMAKGDLNTTIGSLFLAQGSNTCRPYKLMTCMYQPENDPMKNNNWAVVKIQSQWTLGNTRRPYFWDVNWCNTISNNP